MIRSVPLLPIAAGWLLGLALIYADMLSLHWSGAGFISLLVFSLYRSFLSRSFFLSAFSGLLFAVISIQSQANTVYLDESWIQQAWPIEASVVHVTSGTQPSVLLSNIVRGDGSVYHGKIRVYLSRHTSQPAIQKGDFIRGNVSLKRPANDKNPGAFDFEAYLFDHGTGALGFMKDVPSIQAHSNNLIGSIRQKIRALASTMSINGRGLLSAIVLADRSNITSDAQHILTTTGTVHLLAISGLHIALFSGWVFVLVFWLLRRRSAWIIGLPIRNIALLAGVVSAIVYAAIAGWPIPTQRALCLLLAGVLAWLFRQQTAPLNIILCAAILITLVSPASVVSVSFWLSFIATAGIILWLGKREQENHPDAMWQVWVKGIFSVTLVASIVTLPVVAYVFGGIPTYSLLANMLAVPFFSLLILPVALSGSLFSVLGLDPIALFTIGILDSLVSFLYLMLAWISQWPGARWAVPAFSIVWVYILFGLLFFSFYGLRKGRRAVPGVCMVAIVLICVYLGRESLPDTNQFIVWDAGQGSSASLLTTAGASLIFDIPGPYDSKRNGGYRISSALRHSGISHADVLVISHAQQDHMGGAETLGHQLNMVQELWLADIPYNRQHPRLKSLVEKHTEKGGAVRWLSQSQRFQFESISIHVLWPPEHYETTEINNASLVLSITMPNGKRILVPGDIQRFAEYQLFETLQPHDIVLAPHHGSKSSSSYPWIKKTQAGHVIYQAGFNNRFGFPSHDVMQRYALTGAKQWDTSNGAVFIDFDSDTVDVSQWSEHDHGNRYLALQRAKGLL